MNFIDRSRWPRRLASLIPLRLLRMAVYRRFANVTIGAGATVGFGTIIDTDSFALGANSRIGRWNRFVGPFSALIGSGCSIGARNRFFAADWVARERHAGPPYLRTFEVGDDCLITDDHFFDTVDAMLIGTGTWIAGSGSQFWTHGVGVTDRSVVLGQRCYIGSATRIAPGARLGNDCVLSLGSVLTANFAEADEMLVAGVPAKPLRSLTEDYGQGRLERHRRNW